MSLSCAIRSDQTQISARYFRQDTFCWCRCALLVTGFAEFPEMEPQEVFVPPFWHRVVAPAALESSLLSHSVVYACLARAWSPAAAKNGVEYEVAGESPKIRFGVQI